MFNKLIANIAINPSALNTFAFYTKRLKKEKSIRRLGLFFIVLSLLVQIFATMVPAEKSLAFSDNHIINGIKTRTDILNAWDRGGSDIPAIYGKFGLKRQDIANLPVQPNDTIKSTANNSYWSVGRNSLSGYSDVQSQYKSQELALKTDGPTVFFRPLHAWDTNTNYTTYKAFRGRNSTTGKDFWILVDCGNYTQVGKTIKAEVPKKPELIGRKTVQAASTQLKAGDTYKYIIEYRNRIPDSLAEDVQIEDQLDTAHFEVMSPANLKISPSGKLTYPVGNLNHTTTNKSLTLTVRVKANVPNGTKICNTARITSGNAPTITVGGAPETCIVVVVPAVPVAVQTPVTPTPPQPQPTPPPVVEKKPEVKPETPKEEVSPPSVSKNVKNITKNITGATAINTTVSAGDILEYSLTTTNTNSSAITAYNVKDYIGDVLDYADIDTALLASQGAAFDTNTKELVWKNQTIAPKSDLVNTFRVTMKNPLPSTNSPSKVTTSFDCKISNQYGDEVTMGVECPVLKTIEKLPNTGPGTTIGVAFTITVISSYFFARARMLAKEAGLIKRVYQQMGQAF